MKNYRFAVRQNLISTVLQKKLNFIGLYKEKMFMKSHPILQAAQYTLV